MSLLPCWKCGTPEGPKGVQVDGELSGYGYVAFCDACLDEGSFMAHGATREKAAEEWNEKMKDEACCYCFLEIKEDEDCVVRPVEGEDRLFHDGDIPCWEKFQDRTEPLPERSKR